MVNMSVIQYRTCNGFISKNQFMLTNICSNWKGLLCFIRPVYKPSVLFVGHREAVQNQIRRRYATSDQVLHCLLT